MNANTSGGSIHAGSVAVVLTLAAGICGGALTLGFSPVPVSLVTVATTAVGWWAFVSEP